MTDDDPDSMYRCNVSTEGSVVHYAETNLMKVTGSNNLNRCFDPQDPEETRAFVLEKVVYAIQLWAIYSEHPEQYRRIIEMRFRFLEMVARAQMNLGIQLYDERNLLGIAAEHVIAACEGQEENETDEKTSFEEKQRRLKQVKNLLAILELAIAKQQHLGRE